MPHVTIYALCRSSGVLCRKGARADVTNADLPKLTDQMPIRIEKGVLPRTCYFPHPRMHMGVATPESILHLSEIALWDRDQTNPWQQCSASLGSNLGMYYFCQRTFELRKIVDSFKHHHASLCKMHQNMYLFTLEGHVENLTSGQNNTMKDMT